MGEIHSLIIRHGVEVARSMAATKAERNAIEAAASIMGEEESRMGITHAGFAMTSLPHKRIEETVWRRSGPNTTLLVASGHTEQGRPIGVPYGSIARLILLYLQTEAIRTGSAEVELGRSMNAWLTKMNLAIGGKTYGLVAEQAKRISHCRLTFFVDSTGIKVSENGAFVAGRISMASDYDHQRQLTLWQEKVRLDEGFLKSLREHPVPVREEAISAIGTRSLPIDIYIWLAYRLHVLTKPTPISWLSLHSQFGAGFKKVRQFKPTMTDALSMALAVYPEAEVSIGQNGVTLFPSPPAIPKAEARQLGIL
jgi:Plasmid encoded RepA protein